MRRLRMPQMRCARSCMPGSSRCRVRRCSRRWRPFSPSVEDQTEMSTLSEEVAGDLLFREPESGESSVWPRTEAQFPRSKRKFHDPKFTATGEERAHVRLQALKTLWFNTGTLCNLTCRNCYIELTP